jgi:hypothetical protein
MKYLVIPDIHNNHTLAEALIAKVNPEHTIFLGDYFDNFDDTYEDVANTAVWLAWSVTEKNRTHLTGNHDIHYRFADNSGVRCGGYDQGKSVVINNRVKPEHWKRLKYFANVGDWILSHAGVHPYWIDPVKFREDENFTVSKETLINKLERDSVDCDKQLTNGKSHWFEISGHARNHHSPYVGGLLWCDFDLEFRPTRGIHQIIGHTPSREDIRWRVLKSNDDAVFAPEGAKPELSDQTSFNVCFDSYPALKWYGILEGNELSIHETKNALK